MDEFGKYRLIRRLGTGGMAEVFLAQTTVAQGLAKQLVIKKVQRAFARSPQFVSMFVDEAKIALGLNHPNIAQVFDFGAVGETYFLVMEYVEGLDLFRVMRICSDKGKAIPYSLGSYIVQQVAKGLDYAHRKTDEFGDPLGIVHRDVSPHNILVSWDGAVKIVDFGIARARHVHDEEGVIKGKFAYMSPEQARGDPVDRRSDVFAAGAVLFELSCGQPPFSGKGKDQLERAKAGAIPGPRSVRSDLPDQLERLILTALAHHCDDRFQTARDLQNALGQFQLDEARRSGKLVDSAALAQFIAEVVPPESRPAASLPPSAKGAGNRATRPAAGSGSPLARTPQLSARGDGDADNHDGDSLVAHAWPSVDTTKEHKYVVVVTGHIVAAAASGHSRGGDARRIVKDFIQISQDIAFKHEALVHSIEEMSLTFLIGLPVAAEDDDSRAVRLALALVDALDGISADVERELRLAVGIQRGVAVFYRRADGSFRYRLGATTTSIASRLAREAQGAEILVGGRVYRLARSDWNFEEVTSIDLGVADGGGEKRRSARHHSENDATARRLRVYRLTAAKDRRERLRSRTPDGMRLIGRDLELRSIRDAYRDALLHRRKRAVAVLGEDGVGKRSLITRFLRSLPREEALVIRAAARVATAYTPFALVADLGRDLLGLAESADPRQIHRQIEKAVHFLYPGAERPPEAHRVLQTIADVMGADGGRQSIPSDDIDPVQRRQMLVDALVKVEKHLAQDRALVIVAEDLHWADEESYKTFQQLLQAPATRPILAIVTSRSNARALELANDTKATVLQVGELDERDTLAFVSSHFAPGQDVTELATQILARTGGYPSFIGEMLDSLCERGIVARLGKESEHPGQLVWIKREAAIEVPDSLESLLATRLDRLPPEEKDVLLRASVLGPVFVPAALAALLERPVGDALEALVARRLLDRDGPRYRFHNDMIMTVAYRLLPREEQTLLHRRAVQSMATAPTYRPGRDDAVLARHLELAGDLVGAVDHYVQAADHAAGAGSGPEALRLLSLALRLVPPEDHQRRFRTHRQRAEILARLGKRPEQLRELHSLRSAAEATGSAQKQALAHCLLAQFNIQAGSSTHALESIKRASDFARAAGNKLAEAEVLRLQASAARLSGDNETSLRLCDEALRLCDNGRDGLLQRATILNNRGTALWSIGEVKQAGEAYGESLVIYRMLKLPRLEARALNNMGIVFAALGEFEHALAHYKSSVKLDERLGERAFIPVKLANIGQAYAEVGELEQAERYLTTAGEVAQQVGDRRSAADAAISLGQVHLCRGEYRRALDTLERGRKLAVHNRDRHQEIRALTCLAQARLEALEPAQDALDLARSAARLAGSAPMAVTELFALAAQGVALERLGRGDEAVELSRRAAALYDKRGPVQSGEQILHIHALLCERMGIDEEALSAITRAMREVENKASRLRDPGLRTSYLNAKIPAAIAADYRRIAGARPEQTETGELAPA